jgi:hypothetical protein
MNSITLYSLTTLHATVLTRDRHGRTYSTCQRSLIEIEQMLSKELARIATCTRQSDSSVIIFIHLEEEEEEDGKSEHTVNNDRERERERE